MKFCGDRINLFLDAISTEPEGSLGVPFPKHMFQNSAVENVSGGRIVIALSVTDEHSSLPIHPTIRGFFYLRLGRNGSGCSAISRFVTVGAP